MKKSIRLTLVLLAGLVAGGVQAADRGPLKYAEGQYDAAMWRSSRCPIPSR